MEKHTQKFSVPVCTLSTRHEDNRRMPHEQASSFLVKVVWPGL